VAAWHSLLILAPCFLIGVAGRHWGDYCHGEPISEVAMAHGVVLLASALTQLALHWAIGSGRGGGGENDNDEDDSDSDSDSDGDLESQKGAGKKKKRAKQATKSKPNAKEGKQRAQVRGLSPESFRAFAVALTLLDAATVVSSFLQNKNRPLNERIAWLLRDSSLCSWLLHISMCS
jgi:hypothetical protein